MKLLKYSLLFFSIGSGLMTTTSRYIFVVQERNQVQSRRLDTVVATLYRRYFGSLVIIAVWSNTGQTPFGN